jgi:hypothetical protein
MSCRVFNVDRCIHVGMRGVSAVCGFAPEDRLAFAVSFGDKAASGVLLLCVCGVDLHHARARVSGCVGGSLPGREPEPVPATAQHRNTPTRNNMITTMEATDNVANSTATRLRCEDELTPPGRTESALKGTDHEGVEAELVVSVCRNSGLIISSPGQHPFPAVEFKPFPGQARKGGTRRLHVHHQQSRSSISQVAQDQHAHLGSRTSQWEEKLGGAGPCGGETRAASSSQKERRSNREKMTSRVIHVPASRVGSSPSVLPDRAAGPIGKAPQHPARRGPLGSFQRGAAATSRSRGTCPAGKPNGPASPCSE